MRSYSFLRLVVASVLCTVVAATCTDDRKIAAVKQEIATIRSHAVADAAKIPYAPSVYRVFTITGNETKPSSVFVPAGVDAITTRGVLIGLGIFLQADVPPGSDHYRANPNGTVTVDYIQTDGPALQQVDVREIHRFNRACQILGIDGYVRGSLEAFTGGRNLPQLIRQLSTGTSIAAILPARGARQ